MQDLSIVTDTLRDIITAALATSAIWNGPPPFSVVVSGRHPDTPSGDVDCELSLYLFHVSSDKFARNRYWTQASQSGGGTGTQPVAFEPLSIDLWYMLSTESRTSYVREQQVLGVAMQALHEHGTFSLPVATPPPGSITPSHATLVLESPSFDELSRLWQAFGMPLRTTAQYRVSVVLLDNRAPAAAAPEVEEYTLTASPAEPVADPTLPRVLATRRTVTYTIPGGVQRRYEQSPATLAPAPVAAGVRARVEGLRLDDADQLLLVSRAGGVVTETDVTAWKVPHDPPYPATPARGVPFQLRVPLNTPVAPGHYELTVARPALPGFRAPSAPLAIGAWVDPSTGPEITPAGGVYTMSVRGVRASGVELQVGPAVLARIAGGAAPGPGEWQHSSNTVTFAVPGGLTPGSHRITLRADGVDSDPALWAVV
ncbi:DUF4255 domain-containing protein [Antribacter gilvus]|uniref:DUF4255 domain-containing protein n=1 Tax=Antribacter gilvus TaxID=2304675 RepID=UPI000F769E80|nr:DUF4255 domain-containing protein [Antribacter gilvus]